MSSLPLSRWRPVLLASQFALCLSAIAQPSGGGQPAPRPSAEALAACKALSAGANCSFTSQKGQETGTCFTPSADKPLACRPANGGPPGQGQGQGPSR
jgi:hypothetical protein